MSPRSIRRAAEHKARKLAAKQNRLEAAATPQSTDQTETHRTANLVPAVADASTDVSPVLSSGKEPGRSISLTWPPVPNEPRPVSAARLAANRANARRSTGPRTVEGLARVSFNAVKTGLTGRTVLLPSDDAAAYESHLAQYRAELKPVGLLETELVQSLADNAWRRHRIPGLEMAIYAQGRDEFHENFEACDPAVRSGMIELQTFVKYEKQLRNLQLQEARLARRYDKELAELRSLQKERRDAAPETRPDQSATEQLPPAVSAPSTPASNIGFEFSTAAATASTDVHRTHLKAA